jgi:dihydroneopterin aldolase
LDVEPDAVLLQGLTFFARHGVLLEEAALGQKFVVDLELHRCLRTAGATDDVRETVDYSQVYRAVKGIVEGPKRYKLVESIAHEIASTVLGTFGEVHGVKVRVKKPQVALMGQLDYCGVQIHRIRQTGRD